jgi:hypothetical protein
VKHGKKIDADQMTNHWLEYFCLSNICSNFIYSSLNSDLYRINITNDPKCQCGAPYEDVIHYLMKCPLYQNERYCLFRNLRETNKNIETLLFGNDEISINEYSMWVMCLRVICMLPVCSGPFSDFRYRYKYYS